MSQRDEVKKNLTEAVRALIQVRHDLASARAQAAAKGQYIHPVKYQNLIAQEAKLKERVIKLEGQLREMPRDEKTLTLPQAFMSEAEQYLDEVDFANIKYLAQIRMR